VEFKLIGTVEGRELVTVVEVEGICTVSEAARVGISLSAESVGRVMVRSTV
jgi:hypothetical protein